MCCFFYPHNDDEYVRIYTEMTVISVYRDYSDKYRDLQFLCAAVVMLWDEPGE